MCSRSVMPAAALAVAVASLSFQESRACCPGEPREICPVTFAKLDVGIEPDRVVRTGPVQWVEFSPSPRVVRLQWVAQSGFFSDIVRGTLSELRQSGGDFQVALDGCVAEDWGTNVFDDAALPPVGDGFWYLIRADQRDGCPGGIDGSYDSAAPPQVADRDLKILSSGRGCTCYMGEQGYGCVAF